MKLAPYQPTWGGLVAGWAPTDEEMRWLAPGTIPPLTAEKVTGWKKTGGYCLVGFVGDGDVPQAYGELNPMRSDPGHYWVGHIVVDPLFRGQGIGSLFVRGLLEEAFLVRFARRVSLVVFPDNHSAVECYKRCGFRLVGEERHRFFAGGIRHRLLRFEANCARAMPNVPHCGPVHAAR